MISLIAMIWLKIMKKKPYVTQLSDAAAIWLTKSSKYEEELVVMEMSVTKFTLLVVSYLKLPLKDDCIFIFQTLKV